MSWKYDLLSDCDLDGLRTDRHQRCFSDIRWIRVENADNAESVYLKSAACFYRNAALWCANAEDALTSGQLKARLVAAIPRPLGILQGYFGDAYAGSEGNLMLILLSSGILLAEVGGIICEFCYQKPSGVISKLSAAQTSTITDFNSISSINGVTNRISYVPMTVLSGTRTLRSATTISVSTMSGEPLKSATVRWNAPDAPGTVSSGSNPIVTDAQGTARATVVSGPVSFTIQGGTIASGATLQSAVVTTMVPSSGEILVTVPDPPLVVDRKVKVAMTDGSAVPSAQITLRNSYLAYAYQFSGTDVATWGSQKKDAKGYFAQPWCTWCFVPPPAYITGADGTITFKTFNTGATSSAYDVDVLYDDGALAQKVKHTFGTTSDTVTLPLMARITAALTDADPSTPTIDVPVGASGAVDVNVAAVDASNGATSGLTAAVEEVCKGMDTGGLWQSELSIDNMCRDVSVSSVRAFGVARSATCASTTSGSTGVDKTLKITLCPTTSTRYRIRGRGFIATLPFCVIVDGKPCTTLQATAPQTLKLKSRFLTVGKSLTAKQIAGLYKLPTRGNYKVTSNLSKSTCRTSKSLIIPLRPGTCKLVLTETTTSRRYAVQIAVKR
jgi:hypothetical protein